MMLAETPVPRSKASSDSLDQYRNQSSFKWKDMKIMIENPARLEIKRKVWNYLESNPVFRPNMPYRSSDEEKCATANMLVQLVHSGFFKEVIDLDYQRRTKYLMVVNEAVEMFNPNLSIKFALGISLFANALLSLGTQRHRQFFIDVWTGKILSCLAITELAHGSDTKRLRTTVNYDAGTHEFVINTPDIGAAKCWVGNLGKQCSHALLFAQLVVQDVNHGLHAFVVPIRDPVTRLPYPNVLVGDVGEKAGLAGIDNGYVMFHNYRIPKENLLNRIGDINENGEYETSFTDPQKLLGAALESLSAGRVAILIESSNCLIKAMVVAVRYAAQRRQFCDNKGNELSIIEYQTHQWRLFPYLSACYAFKTFVHDFCDQYIELVAKSLAGESEVNDLSQMVRGVHALVCSAKALVTWTSQTAIQEAREACGGHGYIKAAGLGDMRNNHDPRVTFEGDNNVLLQQTSNWILRQFTDSEVDFSVFPVSQLSFITQIDNILKRQFTATQIDDIINEKFIMETYQWLFCWLAKATLELSKKLEKQGYEGHKRKNLYQVFKARTLALVFGEYMVLTYFAKTCRRCENNSLRRVLMNLFNLYGIWSLYRHIAVLYQGNFCSDGSLSDLLCEAILQLCSILKPEAVSLVDALAPPDFVLNSVLGSSDGKIYEKLFNSFQPPEKSSVPEDRNVVKSKL